jgi:hypothetical protein
MRWLPELLLAALVLVLLLGTCGAVDPFEALRTGSGAVRTVILAPLTVVNASARTPVPVTAGSRYALITSNDSSASFSDPGGGVPKPAMIVCDPATTVFLFTLTDDAQLLLFGVRRVGCARGVQLSSAAARLSRVSAVSQSVMVVNATDSSVVMASDTVFENKKKSFAPPWLYDDALCEENLVCISGSASFVGNNCTFRNNSLSFDGDFESWQRQKLADSDRLGYGGVSLMLRNNSRGSCDGCTFENNHHFLGGAALVGQESAAFSGQGCDFVDNTGLVGGATILETNAYFKATGGRFIHNTAVLLAGAIYAEGAVTLIIDEGYFFHNGAYDSGGAVVQVGAGSVLSMNRTAFISNMAMQSGGAICVFANGLTESHQSQFIDNYATLAGGAITLHPQSDEGKMFLPLRQLFLNSTVFKGNVATDFSNILTGYGGAVNADMAVNLTIERCTFESNVARLGGAIASIIRSDSFTRSIQEGQPKSILDVRRTNFLQNRANVGGGIVVLNAMDSVMIQEAAFIGNQAWSAGADLAIQNYAGGIHLVSSTRFCNSTAYFEGSTSFFGIPPLDCLPQQRPRLHSRAQRCERTWFRSCTSCNQIP